MSALSSGSPQPYSLSRQNVLNAVHASKIQASASQKMAPATPQKPQIDWIKYLSIGLGLLLVGTLGMVGIKAGQKVLKEAEEAERLAAEEAKKKLKNTSPENKVDRLIKEQEQKLEEANQRRRQAQAEAQRRADEARRQSSNSYGQESSSQNNQGYGNNGSRYGGNHSQGTNRASGSTPPPPPKTPRELRDEKLLKMGRKNAGTPQKSELISLYNEIATVYGTPLINSNTTIAELRKAQKTLLLKLHSDVNGMEGDWNDPNVRFTTVVDEDRETDTRNINTILDLLKTHHIK